MAKDAAVSDNSAILKKMADVKSTTQAHVEEIVKGMYSLIEENMDKTSATLKEAIDMHGKSQQELGDALTALGDITQRVANTINNIPEAVAKELTTADNSSDDAAPSDKEAAMEAVTEAVEGNEGSAAEDANSSDGIPSPTKRKDSPVINDKVDAPNKKPRVRFEDDPKDDAYATENEGDGANCEVTAADEDGDGDGDAEKDE